jgi:hypothetical protein
MSPETAPTESYTRVSEIPVWLGGLSDQQLSDLVEKRLQGFPAGLPLPGRDEEPKDMLEYAFRKADKDLRARFRQALRGVVDRLGAEVLSKGAALLDDRYDFLEGACSLVAYTNCGEAWDTLSLLYNRLVSGNAKAVRSVILRCLSGLVRPPESQALDVFGPMVEKFESLLTDFDLCGLAFQAIFRYDPRRAARGLPRLVATLLSKSLEDAPHALARILSPMVALLQEVEQKGFIANAWEATLKASVKGSTELADCVLQGLRGMWGIAPGARLEFELLWQFSLFARSFLEVSWQGKISDETAGIEPRNFGSGMIADYSAYMKLGAVDMLNPSGDLARKYESADLETHDYWLAGVRDTSTRYKDSLHEILESDLQLYVWESPKNSPTIYVGESRRKRKAGEPSASIRISPEQDPYLMYPSSKASGRRTALRKGE